MEDEATLRQHLSERLSLNGHLQLSAGHSSGTQTGSQQSAHAHKTNELSNLTPVLKKKKSRVQISASGRVTQCSERVRIMRLTDFFFLWLSIQRRSYFDFESLLLLCSIRTDAAADVHHVSLPAELSNLASAVAALS